MFCNSIAKLQLEPGLHLGVISGTNAQEVTVINKQLMENDKLEQKNYWD